MLNTSGDSLASVPAINQYLKSAQACGVDYFPLLEQVGIDVEILADNNKHIPAAAMEYLLELLIDASGDQCFGLHASRFIEPWSYSVLGYICMNCSTLRMIQAKIPIYEKIVGDMGVTNVTVAGGFALQSWHCKFDSPQAKRHEVEHVLGSWVTYARNFLNFEPHDEVWLEHEPPTDPALLTDYAEVFGCEVLFNQPSSGLRIRESKLDMPLPQANEKLLEMLLEHATVLLAEITQHQLVSDQVKSLLRLMLKQQTPSSAVIAEKLGISSRTLQRKLGEEGTHYKDVLNELRLELALYYLKNTQLNLESIAYELGYAEARSFYRSFKQWTGRTAGSYRSDH
ncbi:AraC family transcriptional regulator [SAR92 clade bacterium H231]|jgi:AraC-like DNA-binding protein|nr:AraC family transcriptional regulator [Porticoccaceae bacterium]MCT2531777.1 AraC family transcriptional regulator [SAR92 clade bacterium H231]MBT6319611.1 AraC family transcriptional regulator [Porticoccaceae bacterium]MBT7904961.1 AraC family transcriptional regulator [Porticoccaceae bacterium]MDA8885487.1 AraC family transcriptional regulator [Porticoccaceae bacterium]